MILNQTDTLANAWLIKFSVSNNYEGEYVDECESDLYETEYKKKNKIKSYKEVDYESDEEYEDDEDLDELNFSKIQ